METGHRTNPRHRPPRCRPPHPRRRPPSPTDRQLPPPAGGLGYSPRARALLRSGRYNNVPSPQWLVKGTYTMLAPGAAPPGAIGDPTTTHRVLRGILQPKDKPPARALAQITSGQAGYHLDLAMLCLAKWIQRRWPSTGTFPGIWAIPNAHTQIEAGPDTRKNPPPKATALPHLRVPRHPHDPPPRWPWPGATVPSSHH